VLALARYITSLTFLILCKEEVVIRYKLSIVDDLLNVYCLVTNKDLNVFSLNGFLSLNGLRIT
jgi:hypothetical protein